MTNERIGKEDLEGFVASLLVASGLDPDEARVSARITVWFDLIGRSTQGLWRIPNYVRRIRKGVVVSPATPAVERQSGSVLVLDGRDGFGYYVADVAADRAIGLARETGVGAVAVRRSNHLGAAGYYGHRAACEGQIGLALSNSFPKVAPWGGLSAVFGTNPLSLACPTRSGKSILIDFSTSPSAGSTLRRAAEEGTPIPEGLVVDGDGEPITDPALAGSGTLLASSPRDTCLALMVELLAGVLTGSGFSHGVGSMVKDFSRPADAGHFLLNLDIEHFMPLPTWYDRVDALTAIIKSARMAAGAAEILIPGERRWREYDEQVEHGLRIDPKTRRTLSQLAGELGVREPW